MAEAYAEVQPLTVADLMLAPAGRYRLDASFGSSQDAIYLYCALSKKALMYSIGYSARTDTLSALSSHQERSAYTGLGHAEHYLLALPQIG